MPKESINHARTPDDTGMLVTVHWQAGMAEPQIGVSIDRASLESYLAEADPSEKTISWYTVALVRADLQRGIRALRRARDASFEADE